mmetsp:Transcript_54029/g.105681  ORF Transcript_54029/g.105681 Transcript_54029/m.105681 type:complete len:303 (+) Transcript_54029:296-1204(+)
MISSRRASADLTTFRAVLPASAVYTSSQGSMLITWSMGHLSSSSVIRPLRIFRLISSSAWLRASLGSSALTRRRISARIRFPITPVLTDAFRRLQILLFVSSPSSGQEKNSGDGSAVFLSLSSSSPSSSSSSTAIRRCCSWEPCRSCRETEGGAGEENESSSVSPPSSLCSWRSTGFWISSSRSSANSLSSSSEYSPATARRPLIPTGGEPQQEGRRSRRNTTQRTLKSDATETRQQHNTEEESLARFIIREDWVGTDWGALSTQIIDAAEREKKSETQVLNKQKENADDLVHTLSGFGVSF